MNAAKLVRKPLLHSATVAVLMSSGIHVAYAQQTSSTAGAGVSDAATEGGLEVVLVTAQKVTENVNDVGMTINALSADDLNRVGFTSPEQLTKVVPGLNITQSGYGLPVYTMRGIGYYDIAAGNSPTVSLYLDETPVTYPIMSRGLALDVQRVEVLKGPQGTLYGQNSTAGLVNYIANRPTEAFTAGVGTSYDNYDRFNLNGFVSGPLTDTLGVRLAASADRGGDWQDSFTRDDDNGSAEFYTARLLADWNATDRLTLQFNANGWVDKTDSPAGQIVGLATAPNRITNLPRATATATQIAASD